MITRPQLLGMLVLVASGSLCGLHGTETLKGTVLDPQHRVVAGAVVALQCGSVTVQRKTGGQGDFVFARAQGFEHCTISVESAGLAPFTSAVGPAPELIVQLEMPIVREVVAVRLPAAGERPARWSPVTSASIGAAELRAISNDTADLIRYAKARAGVNSASPTHIYVNGLPTNTLPPAATVERIIVNADPFSAEYADGADTHIDIITSSADRHLRVNFGGASLGTGGRNVLDHRAQSTARNGQFTLTGPVPHAPLTFSTHADYSLQSHGVPQFGIASEASLPNTTSSLRALLVAADYSAGKNLRINVSGYASEARDTNAGLSGLTLPDAAWRDGAASREFRATVTQLSAHYVYRGGIVADWDGADMLANSAGMAIGVSGALVAGGAVMAARGSSSQHWTLKQVLQSDSRGRHWSAGVTLSHSADAESETPNPLGHIQFESAQTYQDALSGAANGTWLGTRGSARLAQASTTAAPFVEGDVVQSNKLLMRGGIRADYQGRAGLMLSPRLSGITAIQGAVVRVGAGVFVQNWPNAVLLEAIKNDSAHLQRVIVNGVSLTDIPAAQIRAAALDSRISPELVRPRDLILKLSVERQFAFLTPALEYTWTDAMHLLGSRRLPAVDGWVDLLESNRFARRQQVHARLQFQAKRQQITAHYEWLRSRDNTDDPFSFAQSPFDLRAEVARSSGQAPHNFTLVSNLNLPAQLSLTLVDTFRGSAPYNITSGTDPFGNGLYNFRAGAARNSGNGPRFHSLGLFASRRVALPWPGVRKERKTYANLGLQIENLFGNKNYLSLGNVIGSTAFSRPLSAEPGRSCRLNVTFEH